MAKIEIAMPTELMKKLAILERSDVLDEICKKALKAGAEPMIKTMRKRLEQTLKKSNYRKNPRRNYRGTGLLLKALGVSKPDNMRGYWDIAIGSAENHGVVSTNEELIRWFEYGKYPRYGYLYQEPRPILAPTRRIAGKWALEAMERVVNEELEKTINSKP
jgi:hypothetical protein